MTLKHSQSFRSVSIRWWRSVSLTLLAAGAVIGWWSVLPVAAQTPEPEPESSQTVDSSTGVLEAADTSGSLELQSATPPPETSGGAADSAVEAVTSAIEEPEDLWFLTVDWAQRVWNLKLFSAGDTDIHVNQIVVALIVLILGMVFARRIARLAYVRVLKIQRFERSVAFVVQKLVYYTLILVSVFIALPVAGIPITIFALLGGALAIGVGFGAQNLCNNLISGFILLLERPIRLRDTVEVNGMVGSVEEIGSRSTRVRRGDGIDVLVPNSFFLENPIINWTLTDAAVRGRIEVGVAYGSDTGLFTELLMQAMQGLSEVHSAPKPEVLFESFGDNALVFSGYCFMTARSPIDRTRIESLVRFQVDALCREHGIGIAFPQRDVHLDTLKPLDVRLVPGAPGDG